MGVPVILTPQSLDDLRAIVIYIAQDSPERARSFGNKLVDKAISVGAMPEKGRIVPELNDPAVREIIHGSYRIIYEVYHDPTVVYVLRFWNSARGTPKVSRSPHIS
jgi:toxin ParE1/3/4